MKRLALVLLGCLCATLAPAQLFPARPDGTFVADGAALLSQKDRQEISRLSKRLLAETGSPIVVATVNSLAEVKAKNLGVEKYAQRMLDTWKIGAKGKNRGILLLIAKADRKAKIELGKGWRHDGDAESRRIMSGIIVPRFRRGDYSGGIREGVKNLDRMARAHRVSKAPPTGSPNYSPTYQPEVNYVYTSYEPTSPSFGGFGGMEVLVFGMFGLVALIGVGRALLFSGHRSGWGSSSSSWNDNGGVDPVHTTNVWIDNSHRHTDHSSSFGHSHDSGPSSRFDSSPSSSTDSGSSSSGFDSGSSGGGGDTGSW